MGKTTAFYPLHQELSAKIVDFGGWDMPLHYGSQMDEHHSTRNKAGFFDVSHMTVVDVEGIEARDFLRYLLANDVNKLERCGQAQYGAMLNADGGVVDDLITYYLSDTHFRVVVNAATREKDLNWINGHVSGFDVHVHLRDDLAMLAVQGPAAIDLCLPLFSADSAASLKDLRPFTAIEVEQYFVARTGYTGEDGFEIMLPLSEAVEFAHRLIAQGVSPCGLGARDTLRLEAGLNLYGAEMDEATSPLEANMAWTVSFDDAERNFMGRDALLAQKARGITKKLVGVVLQDKGVLRAGQSIDIPGIGEGVLTSGTFSPTLKCGIGLARVPVETSDTAQITIRNKTHALKVIKPNFVRKGKQTF